MALSEDIKKFKETLNEALGIKPPEKTVEELKEVLEGGYVDTDSVQENGTDVVEKEWIWVTGYKGMDKNMRAYGGFQYELGCRYDMDDDEKVEVCNNGYHLCLKMKDVFNHVLLGDDNRFFEVRALVRKTDADKYGKWEHGSWIPSRVNKLAAKSIIIDRELSVDEIMEHVPEAKDWCDEYKKKAITTGVDIVRNLVKIDKLTELGYSNTFAHWLVNNGKYDIAKAVGSQEGLSMDMKVFCIMNNHEQILKPSFKI